MSSVHLIIMHSRLLQACGGINYSECVRGMDAWSGTDGCMGEVGLGSGDDAQSGWDAQGMP